MILKSERFKTLMISNRLGIISAPIYVQCMHNSISLVSYTWVTLSLVNSMSNVQEKQIYTVYHFAYYLTSEYSQSPAKSVKSKDSVAGLLKPPLTLAATPPTLVPRPRPQPLTSPPRPPPRPLALLLVDLASARQSTESDPRPSLRRLPRSLLGVGRSNFFQFCFFTEKYILAV